MAVAITWDTFPQEEAFGVPVVAWRTLLMGTKESIHSHFAHWPQSPNNDASRTVVGRRQTRGIDSSVVPGFCHREPATKW